MKIFRRILTFFCTIALCAVLLVVYAVKVEPYISIVQTYELGKSGGEIIRIVQISDVQISENYTPDHFQELVQKINKQKPDIFLFTGDLYENYAQYGPKEAVIKQLSEIEATYGKFAVWGNRDYGGGCVRHYEEILAESEFTLLTNEGTFVETEGGKRIYLAGLDDYLLGEQKIENIAVQVTEPADYKILMTHEPDTADQYTEYGFELILAGHSHGGQVRIPFIGGLTTSMAEKYTKGFYEPTGEMGPKLYVNSGIGTSHYAVRLGVPPEITVFDIGL